MSALKFIQIIARKKAAEQGGKGITTIANKMQAEAKAGEITETFRAAGLPLENLDTFIKSEKDVTKYLNIIESTRKQAIEAATKKCSKDILKVPKKKEEPIKEHTKSVEEQKEHTRRSLSDKEKLIEGYRKSVEEQKEIIQGHENSIKSLQRYILNLEKKKKTAFWKKD